MNDLIVALLLIAFAIIEFVLGIFTSEDPKRILKVLGFGKNK